MIAPVHPWIAYVGPFRFPWGEPNTRRVDGMARSMARAGRHVVVGSGESAPAEPTRLDGVEGPGSLWHVGLGEALRSNAGLRGRADTFLHWGGKTLRWLDAQPSPPSHVLVHGGLAQYMAHVQPWCRRKGVPLIVDVVDWPKGAYVRGGTFGPLNLSMKVALRLQYPRADGVIAISTMLEERYRGPARPCLRVPPTVDVMNVDYSRCASDDDHAGLVLVYAGNPCANKKDLFSTIMDAVETVDPTGSRLQLRVYGPSPAEFHALSKGDVPRCVRLMGRVPQQEVSHALRQADFSVLVRRPERCTNAGFSTKFCESMAVGTPVIANLTSDMGRYLRHGVNGLVSADHSARALTETLRTALSLGEADLARMRKSARERALESFDFRVYADEIDAFLELVSDRARRGRRTSPDPVYITSRVASPMVDAEETAS
jgi:glycosyltransferase involved in cell wall biosynthesis